jgi:[acyl-carrier-protein] S-malonyltransferase
MKKQAFIFPGQGTQSVGMGADLYQASPAARKVFGTADKVLGFPISRLILEGPQEELDKTINAQPAILTVSLACLEAAKEMNEALPQPDFVAGHSLGEYTSLVAAGALDIPDAVRLVRRRGELMQEASGRYPGGMAAILGLDEFVVEELCGETGAKIANINSETQIVISGDRLALVRAIDLATARGARRTVLLPVSGAFHSTLMRPAQEGLAEAVDNAAFHALKIPVVGNVTARPIKQAKTAKKELLNQLCQCIQWKNSVQYMVASGVANFVEFGPGKVLSGLIKRIDQDAKVTNVNDMTSASNL